MATTKEQQLAQYSCAATDDVSGSPKSYSQPLLEAIRTLQLKDVPSHIEKLKKDAGFKWDEVVRIRLNPVCEVLGRNIIHFLVATDAEQTAISEKDRLHAIQHLLAAGQDEKIRKEVLNELDNTGLAPLHIAAEFSRLAVVELLVKNGADVDFQSSGGFAPLHIAPTNPGHEEITNLLIDNGATVEIKAKNGQTPLHLAASHLRLETVECLLRHLSKLNRLPYDNTLATPLEYARARADGLKNAPEGTGDKSRAKEIVEALSQPYQRPGTAEQPEWDNALLAHLYVARRQQVQQPDPQQPDPQQQQPQFTWAQNSYCKPVGEVLGGPSAWLAEASRVQQAQVPGHGLRRSVGFQGLLSGSTRDKFAFWMHLPSNNVTMVKEAAKLIFNKDLFVYSTDGVLGSACDDALHFVEHMMKSGNLTRPGVHFPEMSPEKSPTGVQLQCVVIPILDINNRSKHPRIVHHTQEEGTQNSTQTTTAQNNKSGKAIPFGSGRPGGPPMRQQKPESSSWEHSLDEYCYGFLSEESLDFRDRDQVITRYFKNYTGEQNLPRLQDTSSTKNPLEDCDEILVVSRFWIWVFGDFVVTNYGGVSTDQLRQLIGVSCISSMNTLPTSFENPVSLIVHLILQQCARHEPFLPTKRIESPPNAPAEDAGPSESVSERNELAFPRGKVRPLDGAGSFSLEIATESHNVANFYMEFNKSVKGDQNKLAKGYRVFIQKETDTLRNIDDILSELAMIKRIQEDIRIVCLECLGVNAVVDCWIKSANTKRQLLENDASRVRQSLITLLSLQQREVATEDLISGQFQNKILFVFTAATVFFVPLSWITSLMALNIKDFTPEDSKWSIGGTATASSVTVAGFSALMILTNWIWGKYPLIEEAINQKWPGKDGQRKPSGAQLEPWVVKISLCGLRRRRARPSTSVDGDKV